MKPFLKIVGCLFLLAGILGFLASSVMLSSTDEVIGVMSSGPAELKLPEDDPRVAIRQSQAEMVLFGSCIVAAVGIVSLVLGFKLRVAGATEH